MLALRSLGRQDFLRDWARTASMAVLFVSFGVCTALPARGQIGNFAPGVYGHTGRSCAACDGEAVVVAESGACQQCSFAGCDQCNCPRGNCRPPLCAGNVVTGVDSGACLSCGEPNWSMRGPIPWDLFAHGEYLGPHRTAHVPQYRLRVDDQLEFVYRLTRERSSRPYQLNVGDRIRLESLADDQLDRDLEIQPDGTITVRLLGQVMAADLTTDELRRELERLYKKFYRVPSITVTPTAVNTKLEDIRATVDSRQGLGGQSRRATVTPEGTIQLPAIGSMRAIGLTLEELRMEVDARYAEIVGGLGVTPVLTQRAARFIYVVGEVAQPGRYELVGPTTVSQAIALAQGWNVGANLNQIVIFRRAEDWRLLATKVDIRGALFGKRPAPSDELWLRDSDVIIVPKTPLKSVTDAINLVFTSGVYEVAPFFSDGLLFFSNNSGI